MGKNLIQQARGKGTPRYTCPSWNFAGSIGLPKVDGQSGRIVELLDCPGHDSPLARIVWANSEESLIPAPLGGIQGQVIQPGKPGCVLALKDMPEGSSIYCIELKPGDRGKLCRAPGVAAKLLAKNGTAVIQLPSGQLKSLNPSCRAVLGIPAAAGIGEKPLLKAGSAARAAWARNRRAPRCKACAMNAVDHPFGNKRSARKAKQRPVNRFAPPGAKVGKLWPRRTGRLKR